MKLISSIVSVVFAVVLIMMVAVPVIGDSLNGDETFYNNGAQTYAFYEAGHIPNHTYTFDGTDFKIDNVKYDLKRLTPAVLTDKAAISYISGTSLTHAHILTGDAGSTAYNSQIVGLKSMNITINGGKISGTVVKTTGSGDSAADHTYTLTESSLSWAYMPATDGDFTTVSIDTGSIYTDSLDSLSYVSAPGNTFALLHDGTVSLYNGSSSTAEALFPTAETVYDDEGGTVIKVTMPPEGTTYFKADSTFWIMAPASVFHDDVEVTTEDQLVSFIPLLLILGVVIGVIGMVVRRS